MQIFQIPRYSLIFQKKDELDKAVEVLKAALKLPQKERNINLLLP